MGKRISEEIAAVWIFVRRKIKIPQPFGSGTEEKRDIRLFRQRHTKLIRDLIQLHAGFLCLPDKEFDLVGFAFTRFAFFGVSTSFFLASSLAIFSLTAAILLSNSVADAAFCFQF